MKIIEPPFTHYLTACAGWLELGNAREAAAELDQLPPELADHPAVIEARWQIEAQLEHWGEALDHARALVRAFPDDPGGWLHQAYALRRCSFGGGESGVECAAPCFRAIPR